MSEGLRWNTTAEGPPLRIAVQGDIDETSDLDGLVQAIDRAAVLDLEHIRRINSTGVREWVRFIQAVSQRGAELSIERCAIPIVQQLNMISSFAEGVSVLSLFAPYVCPECDATAQRLVTLGDDLQEQVSSSFACPECSEAMEFDDLVDHYFSFTRSS